MPPDPPNLVHTYAHAMAVPVKKKTAASPAITDQSAESTISSGQEALLVLLTANKIHNPYHVH